MDSLGVMIDRDMIQNVVATTFTEGKHLITVDFVFHVLVFGILPAVVVSMVPLRRHSGVVGLATIVAVFAFSLLAGTGLLVTNYKTYASVLRERKDFLGSYQPGAPIVGAIRYVRMIFKSTNRVVMPVGTDAAKGEAYALARKPILTVLVAGETARSQNFSLNGYEVLTNPELSNQPVISFSDVNSCGTATAVSLPCMFSGFGRDDYSFEKGVFTENLLDVLHHAGFNVEWWDNNTGDKDIAARLSVRRFTSVDVPEFCGRGECDDGVFLNPLETLAATITEDTVVVLHQIGSHGPAYYLRYPESFEKFKPACRTAEFKNCTTEEIANAYDNTIAYTDHFLNFAIEVLQSQNRVAASLLYLSDHGESLGESGVYLHGLPYFMAPEQQTKVPMILWMSDAFQQQLSIGRNCVAEKAHTRLSHDNLFHSVLGMLDVKTRVYQASLDIFDGCRTDRLVAKND
jgi:lipid A ethanolaminephosphotransferase